MVININGHEAHGNRVRRNKGIVIDSVTKLPRQVKKRDAYMHVIADRSRRRHSLFAAIPTRA